MLNTGLMVVAILVTIGSIVRYIIGVVRKEQNINKWLLPVVGIGALYVVVVIVMSVTGF